MWLRTHLQQAVTYSNIRRINKWVCIPMMCLSSPHYSALQTESGNIQHHNFFPGSTASTTFPSGAVDFVLRPFGNRPHRPVPTLQARGPELQNRALMKDAQGMRLGLEMYEPGNAITVVAITNWSLLDANPRKVPAAADAVSHAAMQTTAALFASRLVAHEPLRPHPPIPSRAWQHSEQ